MFIHIVTPINFNSVTVSSRIFKFLINQIVCVIHCVTTLSNHVNTDNIFSCSPTMIIVSSCLLVACRMIFFLTRFMFLFYLFFHCFQNYSSSFSTYEFHITYISLYPFGNDRSKKKLRFVGDVSTKHCQEGKSMKEKESHLNIIEIYRKKYKKEKK